MLIPPAWYRDAPSLQGWDISLPYQSGAFALHALVMATDAQKQQHQQRNKQNDNPGTLKKFGNRDGEGHQADGQRAQAIDEDAALPALLLPPQPPLMYYHACFRGCEGNEDPTANRLMNRVVSPWKPISSRLARVARTMMPTENAR